MVPEPLPYPGLIVSLTGVLQLLGAVGLFVPKTRSLAGLGLVALLVAMFPANVVAALADGRRGRSRYGSPARSASWRFRGRRPDPTGSSRGAGGEARRNPEHELGSGP